MKFGRIYRLDWDTTDVVKTLASINVAAKNIRVNIYDTEILIDDDADETIINLQPAGDPLTISVINNDDNKMAVVRAKQAVIRFLTDRSAGQDVSLFAEASDNQFKVEILADSLTLFLGFLMISDIEQRFLPDPQVVQVTATDHLGILREIPFTDDDGSQLTGKLKIGQLLALALKKTGLELDINVVNNVKHGSGTVTVDLISFVASGNLIFVMNSWYNYFYPGQRITVTDSIANNITLTVFSVTASFFTIIAVQETLVNEANTANVTLSDQSSGHLYDSIYKDVLSYETNINELADCRTVIERILGFDCFLTQWKGAWWIIRVGEINAGVLYPARFDPDGVFDDYLDPINLQRNIGNTETIGHAQAATNISFDRPHKSVRLTFRFSLPKEVFCNIDFSRGDVISAPNITLIESYGTYQAECWTLRRLFSQPITSTAFIRRRFNYAYEKDRYLVITPKSGTATPWDFMESQPIEVLAKDKANVSISWRYENDFGGGGTTVFPMRIYLRGTDGNWYYWWNPSTSTDLSTFYWTNAGTSELERLIPVGFDAANINESEWQGLTVELGPMPVDGKLYIGLNQGHQVTTGGTNQNINFQSVRVELDPFINGSYGQFYIGQAHKVTRAGGGSGYNATQDEEVFMSDSPRPNFKGAMFWLSSGVYKLSVRFFEAHLYALGSPAMNGYNVFGYFQIFAFWNQHRNANRRFQSTLYGIFAGTSPENWPDLVFKFALTDADDQTNDRFFMLLSLNIDYKNAQWTGLLIECFNVLIGQPKTDTHDFKFLTE